MQQLLEYGFNQQDINALMYTFNMCGKITPAVLQQQMGYDYTQTQRLMYAYNMYCGKISLDSIQKLAKHFRIVCGCTPDEANKMAYAYSLQNGGVNTKESLIRHLKKINRNQIKITMNDLAVSKVSSVPRVAVIANIIQEPFTIWNSNKYKGANALYKVTDVSGQKITIETPRKPQIAYGQPKKVPGVLEIKGLTANGNAVVTFDKNYCKLCNRFIIIASLRMPEFHLGKYEIICFEGTKVYVFAANMGTRENVNYNMGSQRIYDYGIFPQDIKSKLDKVAKGMYQYLKGMNIEYQTPTSDYKVVPVEKKIDTEADDIEY